jgi:alpha-D-ribose 1-methylphosphonate 5-triphosphate diphosphatase
MVLEGLCDVLASDYYYPSQLSAAFKLIREDALPLAQVWPLVSTNAAAAAGLADRGRIADGQRADLVLVDATGRYPVAVATLTAGRLVHLARDIIG